MSRTTDSDTRAERARRSIVTRTLALAGPSRNGSKPGSTTRPRMPSAAPGDDEGEDAERDRQQLDDVHVCDPHAGTARGQGCRPDASQSRSIPSMSVSRSGKRAASAVTTTHTCPHRRKRTTRARRCRRGERSAGPREPEPRRWTPACGDRRSSRFLTLTARWRRLPDRAIGNAESPARMRIVKLESSQRLSGGSCRPSRQPTPRVGLAHGQRQVDRPDLIVDGSVGPGPQRHGLTADQLEAWNELTAGHQQLPKPSGSTDRTTSLTVAWWACAARFTPDRSSSRNPTRRPDRTGRFSEVAGAACPNVCRPRWPGHQAPQRVAPDEPASRLPAGRSGSCGRGYRSAAPALRGSVRDPGDRIGVPVIRFDVEKRSHQGHGCQPVRDTVVQLYEDADATVAQAG